MFAVAHILNHLEFAPDPVFTQFSLFTILRFCCPIERWFDLVFLPFLHHMHKHQQLLWYPLFQTAFPALFSNKAWAKICFCCNQILKFLIMQSKLSPGKANCKKENYSLNFLSVIPIDQSKKIEKGSLDLSSAMAEGLLTIPWKKSDDGKRYHWSNDSCWW